MTRQFIFDVDGTLTPSRELINPEFAAWFSLFCTQQSVCLVTGSDVDKTIEQLGEYIFRKVVSYNCSGNEIWEYGKLLSTSNWKPSFELLEFLLDLVEASVFPIKTKAHIEIRSGTLNFSTVGRNANLEQRKAYKEWDSKHKERACITAKVKEAFPEIDCLIGGETGVDIYPKGNDKSQILKNFNTADELIFFGDKTTPGGNDYPLAAALSNGNFSNSKTIAVKNWKHTWEILKRYDKMV